MKFIILTIAFVAGIKYGSQYLLSDEFVQYADRSKASWTCHVESLFGHIHLVRSHYQSAYYRFSHILDRCPDTALAERAQFEVAHSLELLENRYAAAIAYDKYIEKYPHTKRAKTARRSIDLLRGP